MFSDQILATVACKIALFILPLKESCDTYEAMFLFPYKFG